MHPTFEQVVGLIYHLKLIEEEANKEGMFDLTIGSVSCGSPACVAGWYALSTIPARLIENCNYMDGATCMAIQLGFVTKGENRYDNRTDRYYSYGTRLKKWANNNPHIWGNENGALMFVSEIAYNGLSFDSKNPMTIIIAHWEAIRDKLLKYESYSKPNLFVVPQGYTFDEGVYDE